MMSGIGHMFSPTFNDARGPSVTSSRLHQIQGLFLGKPPSSSRAIEGMNAIDPSGMSDTVRFRFVEKHIGAFPTERLCQVMNVSPRGLRANRCRRQHLDMVVLVHIQEQSRLSLGSHGRPRMTEELKEGGVDVGHRRVGRVRRENSSPD